MKEDFLLKTDGARELYARIRELPIIDFHNHLCVADIRSDKKYEHIVSLWLAPDPYKHRLMRICGVDEHYITGDADPFEKFEKYCAIFPYLAGNPVYDWSRMELSLVFGIEDPINAQNARRIYDRANELLASPEFSNNGILSRFRIAYQSPVAKLPDDLTDFDGKTVAPSLRADDLLAPTEAFKAEIAAKSGIAVSDENSYFRAVCRLLDRFAAKGCRFADHSLDARFFREDAGKETDMLIRLGTEYAKRGWTLLLHMNAERETSPRLLSLAGPAGGFAAAGEAVAISRITALLGEMERQGAMPDTVLFSLNLGDQAPLAVLQGSYAQSGVPSKVQLGPAWWWCDSPLGIRHTLESVSSFGVLSQFIGMTTDSRSILSFVRHDYFRRLLCAWLDEKNTDGEWGLSLDLLSDFAAKIAYENAKAKLNR